MRKVDCFVRYTCIVDENHYMKYTINNFIVVTRQGHMIDITKQGTLFHDFKGMYRAVLHTLKNNNMYVGKFTDFGTTFYEIQWLNSDIKGSVERRAYDE